MKYTFRFNVLFLILSPILNAQEEWDLQALEKDKRLHAVNAEMDFVKYKDLKALKVWDAGIDTEVKFIKMKASDFKDGVIELELAGKPGENASEQARGFVGIAFRINDDHSKFECIYLRPSNGRADDQVRRNHSVQYISYPEYPWHRLRKEYPKMYETYVDLVPGEWTKVKIAVRDDQARLYVHGQSQPTLIVNDLKHGKDASGSIGLWIGPGTEAHFSNLKVTHLPD
ncbi:MAG: hypothetical protein KA340_13450 [Saprospiraceae bacterium]|nr:hypothetical protein [Saprospiraceae bacterium]